MGALVAMGLLVVIVAACAGASEPGSPSDPSGNVGGGSSAGGTTGSGGAASSAGGKSGASSSGAAGAAGDGNPKIAAACGLLAADLIDCKCYVGRTADSLEQECLKTNTGYLYDEGSVSGRCGGLALSASLAKLPEVEAQSCRPHAWEACGKGGCATGLACGNVKGAADCTQRTCCHRSCKSNSDCDSSAGPLEYLSLHGYSGKNYPGNVCAAGYCGYFCEGNTDCPPFLPTCAKPGGGVLPHCVE